MLSITVLMPLDIHLRELDTGIIAEKKALGLLMTYGAEGTSDNGLASPARMRLNDDDNKERV